MLTMLFLLFCLNTSLLISNEVDVETYIDRSNKYEVYNEHLIYKEGGVREAYPNWEGIPIFSPLKVRNIKYVSSDYGYRRHPILLRWGMHHGIDFAAKKGTTVYSTADGVVTDVTYSRRGYGNEITIRHRNGYSTRYAHLDEIFVEEGQYITDGSYIGTVGSTGLSTGPHLHYEILLNNRSIDPMYFTYGTEDRGRSKNNYFKSLIALEGQQAADKKITSGVKPIRYAHHVQVVTSSKIN